MRKTRDFKCQECGHRAGRIVEDDVLELTCEECSSTMQRQLSAPKSIGGSVNGTLRSGRGFN